MLARERAANICFIHRVHGICLSRTELQRSISHLGSAFGIHNKKTQEYATETQVWLYLRMKASSHSGKGGDILINKTEENHGSTTRSLICSQGKQDLL